MKRAASIALTIVAIAGAADALAALQAARVTGTITYRERIALSPDAIVEVRLEDVTRAEGTPPVVSRMRLEHAGQVPIKFELPYDPRLVHARGRYAVRATISDRGVDLFTSLDTALVLTQGHDTNAALTLTRIGTPKPPTEAAARPQDKPAPTAVPAAKPLPPHPFVGFPLTFAGTVASADGTAMRWHLNLFGDDSFFLRTTGAGASTQDDLGSWSLSTDRRTLTLRDSHDRLHAFQVVVPGTLRALDNEGSPRANAAARDLYRAPAYRPLDLHVRLRGSYTPDADGVGATIVECTTGQRWIVASEAAAAELTKAYAAARMPAGTSVLAELDGTIANRAPADARPISTVVVTAFGRLLPRQSCAPRFVAAPLTDTAWRLTHLGERPVPPNADARLNVTMTFQPASGDAVGSFAGSSGCNRLIGMYAVNDAAMSLTPGGNMRSCKDQGVPAETIIAALKTVRAYRISGAVLELVDEGGRRVARFDARPVQ